MASSNSINTIPNAISLIRALLGPLTAMLLIANDKSMLMAALAIMVLAELSDFLDGYIARKFDQQSDFGRFIDPVSDSIYRLSVFLAFFFNDWMPVWMFILIYARDLVVPYLRTFTIQSGHSLPVRWSGKLKAVVQGASQIGVVAILSNFLGLGAIFGESSVFLLLTIATTVSVVSLADYFVEAVRITKT